METNKIKGSKASWFKKGKKQLSTKKLRELNWNDNGPSSKPVLDHYES